jgi:aldehyde:ferredoxin oxidoreductase
LERIIIVNLSQNEIQFRDVPNIGLENTGRALALSLLKEFVPDNTDYFNENNVIVITPGLISGTYAPSSGRFSVVTKRTGGGLRSVNLAGPFANRLMSLGYLAIVVRGTAPETLPVILVINEKGAALKSMPAIRYQPITETISYLRQEHGKEASVIGIGPAGEHVLPLGTIFSTYPPGKPEYFCVRGGMGDAFGNKGLKAIVVSSEKEFNANIVNPEIFNNRVKELTAIIREHPICGKALPSYGSITLMKILKNGGRLEEDNKPLQQAESSTDIAERQNTNQPKVNRACSVNCPIGCLNRHTTAGISPFDSPFDSEAFAACQNYFGITDQSFVINLNKKCFELGLDSIEFLSSCALLMKINHYQNAKEGLIQLLEELRLVSPVGRILGSNTSGIYSLYAEYKELRQMVTRKATSEHANFKVQIPNRIPGVESLSEMEYLYSYILAAQNIGMCLFTTFAMIDNPEALTLLAQLATGRTGKRVTPLMIIQSGYDSLLKERAYELDSMKAGMLDNIPEFVKVLYRYFGREKQ